MSKGDIGTAAAPGIQWETSAKVSASTQAALKAASKTYEIHMYKGVNHAFNNDTNAARYDKAAADLAWGRTIAFLKKYVA